MTKYEAPINEPDLALVKVMMTLAGMVYAQPPAIAGYLAQSPLYRRVFYMN
jgi:hypothetical protein